jgi:hypothetical protein
MSQENVAIVQRFADHWNETGEPLWAKMDPEVVFEIDPGSFVAGTYNGHDGVRTSSGSPPRSSMSFSSSSTSSSTSAMRYSCWAVFERAE